MNIQTLEQYLAEKLEAKTQGILDKIEAEVDKLAKKPIDVSKEELAYNTKKKMGLQKIVSVGNKAKNEKRLSKALKDEIKNYQEEIKSLKQKIKDGDDRKTEAELKASIKALDEVVKLMNKF